MVQEPDVARSSGRVVSIAGVGEPLPARNIAALGLVEFAVLLIRASAILLLISPLALLAMLAFG